MIFIPLLGAALGVGIALFLPYQIPITFAKYSALAILATLDAIFGGLRAQAEGEFIISKFVVSFFVNAGLAVLLAYLGDQLGVDIHLGAVVAFSIRIFHNLSLLREILFKKFTYKQ
ncbi:MAG TPA: small basic family protein [Bacillota bacterium]